MNEKINQRFESLLREGDRLVNSLPRDQHGVKYWVESLRVPEHQAWLGSAANLIRIVAGSNSYFVEECKRMMGHESLKNGVPSPVVQKMYGLLNAAKKEWEQGLLREIEYIVAAATFDDFLDHAAFYHRGNKKVEASVLASAVLEDTVKKIALKNGLNPSGQSLEGLIDELVKIGVFTQVKAKRVKGFAGVRNSALHAEWNEFDIRDVGELIKGTRELIDQYL